MLYIKRKELKRKFGTNDVEGLALNMYNVFHGHPSTELGWTPYKKWKCDPVVQAFRMAALVALDDLEFSGLNNVYKDVV